MDGADFLSVGAELPIIGVIVTAIGLVLLAIVAVLFIVPALVFVGELLFIVAVVGLGLVGRVLLGRPWAVEARQQGADDAYEWQARGWRASGDLVKSIAEQLRRTGRPTGGTQTSPGPT
jgi:small-conductance mechanosensitive channel